MAGRQQQPQWHEEAIGGRVVVVNVAWYELWMGRSSGSSRLMVQGRIDQRGREERSVRGRSEQQLDDKKPPVFPPVATEQNCSSCWRWAAAFAMRPC